MSNPVGNAIAGVSLALLSLTASYAGIQIWREQRPATDWIEITQLIVRDAEPGVDPRIVYARTIKDAAPADWRVSVSRFDGDDKVGTTYCVGTGIANYVKARKLPPDAIRLSWLMGREERPCHFTKGTYRATVTITVTPHGYLPKVLTYDSNYFIVPPSENLVQEPP